MVQERESIITVSMKKHVRTASNSPADGSSGGAIGDVREGVDIRIDRVLAHLLGPYGIKIKEGERRACQGSYLLRIKNEVSNM